jgi:hypothetical protein
MTDLRDAARQALEALMWHDETVRTRGDDEAIAALRAALEQPERAQAMRDAGYARRPTLREMAEPEQEPVAWMRKRDNRLAVNDGGIFDCDWTPLFTHPPRREWRGLTEEDRSVLFSTHFNSPYELVNAIEAALRSKNHE